ncbi:glycerophosphodiester phosphodiesterase family protein [Teredinibacter sp. KSP-S5-2]|uniref:glycerophosphodiester phosphodiesterase family protein n=1 Tax=Teredinibacter sp. KSP-S5-2 TaxID=3034506 RepID=UPI002934F598|nr:glycerophosphodiester phosphodiesterase family protein [Teredinibacter sp. KSP-S5-2]WNO09777.1 glycerophosphodiester phosphodiesterase family protein [Teredinibacter sp. KSP-S5-2]
MTLLIVGHRGWPEYYPENSLQGIQQAIDSGIEAVEIDVQFSIDAIPVVIHDPNLKRTAEQDVGVATLTSEQLKLYSAHEPDRFQQKFYPTPIISLEFLLSNLKVNSSFTLFIEIKQEIFERFTYSKVVETLRPLLEKVHFNATLISYDEVFLTYCKQHLNTLPLGWVLTRYDDSSRDIAGRLIPDWLICNANKCIHLPAPLWSGSWRWMIYDITDQALAGRCLEKGTSALESWDFQTLTNQ